MNKLLLCIVVVGLFITSCKKKFDTPAPQIEKDLITGTTVDTLRGRITTNTTLTKTTYLHGMVFVDSGVTLTVNPGVTIKASMNTMPYSETVYSLDSLQYNRGYLIVEKGAKLIANGTAAQPIVWTSNKPVGSRNAGDWGGIILLGRSTISSQEGTAESLYKSLLYEYFTFNEDEPWILPLFKYGGANPDDNSGSMAYNRIEFAGSSALACRGCPGRNWSPGLSLCGVGTGTTIHHVEVMRSKEDAFAFFGGTINADHLVAYSTGAEDFNFTEGYNGHLQFIIAYRTKPGVIGHGSTFILAENNEAAGRGYTGIKTTRPFIANATFIGPAIATYYNSDPRSFDPNYYDDGGVYVRRKGRVILANSLVAGNAEPNVVAVTPSTGASFGLAYTDPNSSVIVSSIFQNNGNDSVVVDTDEYNPVSYINSGSAANNAALVNKLKSFGCSFVGTYANFKLDGTLTPATGSSALSGGHDLSSYGLIGTTERGAVLTTDKWTTSSGWISIASN